jgi:3-phosphoshikimate 1-carboxyvinyltransferase
MRAIIEPGNIAGALNAPPSKSFTQRAYAAALLHHGTTIIHNAGNSTDERAALEIIQQLGAQVTIGSKQVTIISEGLRPLTGDINCGESGLAARLFTPIAALSDQRVTISGTGTLLQRPMEGFAEILSAFGISIDGFNGYLPVTLQGPLQPHDITIDASGGSQLLSGLLFALGTSANTPITLKVRNLKSRPYIDMTLQVLDQFGYNIEHNNYREFHIKPKVNNIGSTLSINVEADWSSAAFLLVAGAIAGSVTLNNLDMSSVQADRAVIDVLRMAGAEIRTAASGITVSQGTLHEFEFDATHSPDLFPVLAVLAACCEGESQIKGVHRLFSKESNRVESVTEMLFDFGVPFSVENDVLFVSGVESLQGTLIDSYHDHRIAMAAAVGALSAKSRVDILHAEAVNKSYPDFFRDLELCGGKCNFINE